jgi:hypothetical protein
MKKQGTISDEKNNIWIIILCCKIASVEKWSLLVS